MGCHDPIGNQGQLILTEGRAHAATVSVPSVALPTLPRIAPGDASNSYLYRKLTGAGIFGARMPVGALPLDDARIQLVRDWILRGAPND